MMNIHKSVSPRAVDPFKGLIAGLVGGVAGSLAMVAAQGIWSRATGLSIRPAEHDVAGDAAPAHRAGDPSTVRAARLVVNQTTGHHLDFDPARLAGRFFHFAFGLGMGGAYGVLVEYAPVVAIGSGVPFGTIQMVAADEWGVPALGLSGPPGQAPASAHLGSLVARIVYSLTTEQVRRAIRAQL